jgi:hypothetical protein
VDDERDTEIIRLLQTGQNAVEIACDMGVSHQAVYKRIKRLRAEGLAPVVVAHAVTNEIPMSTAAKQHAAEQRNRTATSHAIDVLEKLVAGFRHAERMVAACERYLQDPNLPGEFYVGPRAEDLKVVYKMPVGVRKDGTTIMQARSGLLSELLLHTEAAGTCKTIEVKHADPRKLMLEALAEYRQIMMAGSSIASALADTRAQRLFTRAVMEEIGREAPEVAERIALRIRANVLPLDEILASVDPSSP